MSGRKQISKLYAIISWLDSTMPLYQAHLLDEDPFHGVRDFPKQFDCHSPNVIVVPRGNYIYIRMCSMYIQYIVYVYLS